jgi:hypothetical protein
MLLPTRMTVLAAAALATGGLLVTGAAGATANPDDVPPPFHDRPTVADCYNGLPTITGTPGPDVLVGTPDPMSSTGWAATTSSSGGAATTGSSAGTAPTRSTARTATTSSAQVPEGISH